MTLFITGFLLKIKQSVLLSVLRSPFGAFASADGMHLREAGCLRRVLTVSVCDSVFRPGWKTRVRLSGRSKKKGAHDVRPFPVQRPNS